MACIVMHGMGNWQLSIFYFQSTEIAGALSPGAYVGVGIASIVISDGLLILFFYLVHRYYWQPHRKGEPAFGGMLNKYQDFVHSHDFEKQPLQKTFALLVAFIVVVMAVMVGVTHAVGETDTTKFTTTALGDQGTDLGDLESLVEESEIIEDSGQLGETESDVLTFSSIENRYLKEISVTVTWTDEEESIAEIQDKNVDLYSKLHVLKGSEREEYFRNNIENNEHLKQLKYEMDKWCSVWFWPVYKEDIPVLSPDNFYESNEELKSIIKEILRKIKIFR